MKNLGVLGEKLGELSALALLALSGLCFLIVVLRYVFQLGWVSLQELLVYFHATAFLLGSAYALKKGAHVKVDVFFERLTSRQQCLVQLFGLVFLYFPFFAALLYFCFPYVKDSWMIGESSPDSGGLPGLYVLKSLLLFFPVVMIFQGLWWFKKSFVEFRGGPSDT